ncbi:VWA domain-containing protein [Moorena sp. SIO3H5]|uniref:vWA domain-containing protein n=1 Tax=Moorena sp. SIO3H5 TaxID=2607834 RepID=UPI0025D2A3BD|nr:VWA domain-containing protein [Moorena sp. SIO3H5]
MNKLLRLFLLSGMVAILAQLTTACHNQPSVQQSEKSSNLPVAQDVESDQIQRQLEPMQSAEVGRSADSVNQNIPNRGLKPRAPRRLSDSPNARFKSVPSSSIPASKRMPLLTAEQAIPEVSNRENYSPIDENAFKRVKHNPLSTFAIDVDTASYSNLRRFLNNGQLPPTDAIRIEELINYFNYDYPEPESDRPFSITTEISQAPWNPTHKLVHIGIQGEKMAIEDLPPSNLVFLLDVSGSMNNPNKLPLLKDAFRMLVNELREEDQVSIVVYAGAAGVVLPPTPGNDKDKILTAIENLNAGGSTAGGAGIQLAYKLAQDNFIKSGNNRVILATDGDFNVGVSSDTELVKLIEQKRKKGVFLTVLGFGTGNLQDSKMEKIANKGNGNYAYIDNELEAKKVLVNEIGATLLTIAKDVKIQVEFNPAKVQAYRLIGYENRRLKDEDFNDDTKDAGELGAGHTVTALYEIIPVGAKTKVKLPDIDPLKYQSNAASTTNSKELMQVKLRYKEPDGNTSQLLTYPLVDKAVKLNDASDNFKFSAAVASFGMVLRDSPYKGKASFDQALTLAKESEGVDLEGYRAEFIDLVESAEEIGYRE